MHEPRGHAEMYGAVLVEPDDPAADLAVLFLHGQGYSTMCGHAIIALGRWAVDSGRVEAREPETEVAIQAPCGLVRARVQVWRDGGGPARSEEHTSELQSLMRISYAVFCLKKKITKFGLILHAIVLVAT